MASPVTIQPSTIDNGILQGDATGNYAGGASFNICPDSARAFQARGLISFNFSAVVPAGATITLATLSLYCSTYTASRTITVYRLLRADWTEAGSTWNRYKSGSNWGTAGALGSGVDFTPTDAATAASVAVGNWLNETVTAQVQTALNSVSGVAHFLIADIGASVTTSNAYRTREYTTTTQRPKLYIEYTVPPPLNYLQTVNGLAKASVATRNGLAIASIKTWNGLA